MISATMEETCDVAVVVSFLSCCSPAPSCSADDGEDEVEDEEEAVLLCWSRFLLLLLPLSELLSSKSVPSFFRRRFLFDFDLFPNFLSR